ncbi:MAG: hypothetical protein KF794_07125 [Xanthobacteraceae bacterium]|nr:hypothetical protein [Xanthobacteraceae bacterium]QYK46435.1 MAG: hypothetical protein KF794_07125 [Xanthobacteraceae bacterium]
MAAREIKLPKPVAKIYEAVAELDALYNGLGRKFTPDGHLVGSIGEVIAAEHFNLKLLPGSTSVHDAVDEDGCFVQIKLTAGKRIALNACCDRLIVLRVVNTDFAEVIYDGPGKPIWDAAGAMQKNGQRPIGLATVKRLAGG